MKKKILLVDDSATARMLTMMVLAKSAYEILSASGAKRPSRWPRRSGPI